MRRFLKIMARVGTHAGAAAAIMLAVTSATPGCDDDAGCTDDFDCDGALVCKVSSGSCEALVCKLDSDCSGGQSCDDNVCE